ncbi:LOW QUALITY PROTEIN: venom allergen 5-like [Ixodes scapularis]|uniref:LOW QUALITY PROTEIN: venom allergen 5-like n=1 Tax=Ixodes scapularis TaxID=6945 RepID=UPI001C391731|nr:LOW QUALITY PROTEIN: venom allergen 5-like [Ixodes scapularis]
MHTSSDIKNTKTIWDDELAEVAQAHADQCTVANRDLRHDNKKGRFTTKFRCVGQNLAWEAAPDGDQPMNVTRQVTSWFNEYRDFDPAGIERLPPQFGKQTGHFTQIIWAETQFLGCGFTQYTLHGDRSPTPYQKIYVCNYAPAGNFLSFPVYEAGAPCSKCPKDTTCQPSIGLYQPGEDQSPEDQPKENHLPRIQLPEVQPQPQMNRPQPMRPPTGLLVPILSPAAQHPQS